MKVIIAGSRKILDYTVVEQAVEESGFKASLIISGGAHGVDRLGEEYAKEHGIPLKVYRADWKKHGRSAGYIRNGQMAAQADALVAIWDGASKGTRNMIVQAKDHGLEIFVKRI